MIRLVTGGVRSGKSRFAEDLAKEMGQRVLYVATGVVTDKEMQARVQRHRERRPREWGLVEEPLHLTQALSKGPERDGILVDCLSTWVANRLMQLPEEDGEERRDAVVKEMEEEMERVLEVLKEGEAVLVTSETGLGGVAMTPLGRLFQDTLGSINQQTARRAEEVWMVVSGVPWKVKG
ncbi:adenosylcobinamide kinase/adenosylcobinamide-phosphate guanylyltransferase [Kroppenstedtia sanguinis]|uniref:Adenosylcobinamide kinase n=1 Tax=Kroppenstedtia sanguinis TaxID=1380684 RepID=A0ABW4CAB8_9BACL